MITIEDFDNIIEKVWKEDFKEETKLYSGRSKDLENSLYFQKYFKYKEKGISFFELESNLSHNFYRLLKNELIEKGLFPDILINVQGECSTKKPSDFITETDKKPDMMIIKNERPWVIMEFKTGSPASNNKVPSLPGVEKDIIKLSELYDIQKKEGVERTYLFLFSRSPWKRIQLPKDTHENAIECLKEGKHLRIGYGFYEEEKWDFWKFPFEGYPDILKNPP